MNIAFLTYGSQGDVEPFIALAGALTEAGHQVKLAAPELFSKNIENNKIEFVSLPGDPGMMVDNLVDRAGKNVIRMVTSMTEFVYPLAAEVFQKARSSCQDADLVIHSFLMASTGYEIARELGVPDLSVQFFPVFTSSGEIPAPAFPDLPLGPIYRRFTHNLTTWLFWNGSQLIYHRVQKRNPSLPDLTGWPFSPKNPHQTPILYAYSPRIVPFPADWPDGVSITGYWIRKIDHNWQPAPELLKFLEAGPPPIAVTFGSTSSSNMKQIQDKIVQALARVNQRGVFVGSDSYQVQADPDIQYSGYVPYLWLFNRSSAAIHHGGAGTTARAFISGVPQITLPFTSDQPFWGRRVYQLGAGPKPLSSKRFSILQLVEAINTSLNDSQMKAISRELSEKICQENGLAKAVETIEGYLTKET